MSHVKRAALVFFLSAGYVMRYLSGHDLPKEINHLYFLIGGLGFALSFVRLTYYQKQDHQLQKGLFQSIVGFFGFFAIVGLLFCSVALTVPMEQILVESVEQDFSNVLMVDMPCIIWMIIYMIFVQTKYIVKDGTIVVLKDEILYPGERYHLWPFSDYDDEVVKKKINFFLKDMIITCRNVTFKAHISTCLILRIKEAEEYGITSIPRSLFIEIGSQFLEDRIQNQAKLMSAKDILSGTMGGTLTLIGGFPVRWDGKIQITTV